MALDLNQSNVSITDAKFQPMLEELQPNILKGHGRDFGYHIFVHLDKAKAAAAKQWIRDFASKKLISALKQLQDVEEHHRTNKDGGPIFTLSLAKSGYDALGIASVPGDPSFRAGLKSSADKLHDEPAKWEADLKDNLDMLVIVADDDHDRAAKLAEDVKKEISAFGKVVKVQKGKTLKQKLESGKAIGLEHFGYADGVSQPLYLSSDIAVQKENKFWRDEAKLNILLIEDPGGKTSDSFGSYLVFRKLEQNVKEFKQNEGDIKGSPSPLPRVKDATGKNNDDLPGAMVVGRFENGTPVITSNGVAASITSEDQLLVNDFNYTDDPHGGARNGSKCPFHAHIRIANPRTDVGEFGNTVRITRRAMPYDDVNRFGVGKENETIVTGEQLDAHLPDGGVGLLFMCYQSNIPNHFEFIQSTWVDTGLIRLTDGTIVQVGQDGIIGQGPNPTSRSLPEQWGQLATEHTNQIQFGGHVTMKGGEYFFTPSLSFLKEL